MSLAVTSVIKSSSRHSGFTLIELMLVIAMLAVLTAIALPLLARARMTANESSAISSLRAISRAQLAYASTCGRANYATALTTLAIPTGATTEPFLSLDLSSAVTVQKSGFIVTMNNGGFGAALPDCNGTPTATGYYASSAPVSFGATGSRSFAMSQNGTIYYAMGAAAPNPPTAGQPLQ